MKKEAFRRLSTDLDPCPCRRNRVLSAACQKHEEQMMEMAQTEHFSRAALYDVLHSHVIIS